MRGLWYRSDRNHVFIESSAKGSAKNEPPCNDFGVHNIPNSIQCLFAARCYFLPTADEHVPLFGCAACDLHEFIEIQDFFLAARPSLAAFVKDWMSWVMHALLVFSRSSALCGPRLRAVGIARPSAAGHILCNGQRRIIRIRLGLWCRSSR